MSRNSLFFESMNRCEFVVYCVRQLYTMIYTHTHSWLVAWHSGSIVRHMNKVTLCWAMFVLGWVTIRCTSLVCKQANLVNLALHPSRVAKLSSGLNWLG